MNDHAVTLVGALGALLLLFALLYSPDAAPPVSQPTSEDPGPNGYLGLANWLAAENIATVSLRRRLDGDELAAVIADRGNIMVMTLPYRRALRRRETAALLAWVEAGNTLLALSSLDETPDWSMRVRTDDLFDDIETLSGLVFTGAEDPDGELIEKGGPLDAIELTYLPHKAHPLMQGVDKMSGESDLTTSLWLPDLQASEQFIVRLAYESTENVDMLWQVPRGQGRVILSASSSLLSNEMLGKSDNARFFGNVIAWHLAPGGAVLFDDMHQGLSDLYDPEAFFADARLHNTLWFILVFWLLYLLGGSGRLGSGSQTADAPREADLVAASGRFMERKLNRGEAGRAMIDSWLSELYRARLLSGPRSQEFPDRQLARLPTIDQAALRRAHDMYSKLGSGGKVDLAKLHNTLRQLRESTG